MKYTTFFLPVCFVICAAMQLSAAEIPPVQIPPAEVPPAEVDAGAFSKSYLLPYQLQFSDASTIDMDEERFAEQLADSHADPIDRLAAARALWRGRSRRHASEVLKFLDDPPPGGDEFRQFQRDVQAAIAPDAILHELREGDYLWGTWLAFLRPQKDFAPVLIDALKTRLKELPETILALGNTGEALALKPLLELLKSKDDPTAGFAADALGYLGDRAAEPILIEMLFAKSPWVQCSACGALGKLGTQKAIAALEPLASDNRFTGVISLKGCAEQAIEQIKKRRNSLLAAQA